MKWSAVLTLSRRGETTSLFITITKWCDTSLSEILCWPAGPHLHTDLQQITGAVRSPLMLQILHHHPVPKKPKITGLNDFRPVALTSVVMKSFERLVLAYLKASTGHLLDPLRFAYRANRSVNDAVNMGLHFHTITYNIIVCIVCCVFDILYIAYLYIVLLLSVSCPVAVILLHCVASVTITNSSYI